MLDLLASPAALPLAEISPGLGLALGLAIAIGVVLAIALPLRALARRQRRNKHSWSSQRPLLTMFTRPRDTYRWLVEERPGLYVVAIGALEGLVSLEADPGGWPLWVRALLGMLSGILTLFFMGWVLWLVGKLFGGKGDVRSVRTTFAWAAVVPIATALPVTLLGDWAEKLPLDQLADGPALMLSSAVTFSWTALIGWYTWLTVAAIAEGHGFSMWRGLFTLLLVITPPLAFLIWASS